MKTLSIIILTKNNENDLLPALISSQFASEVIVVDTGSTDNTVKLAQKHKAQIVHTTGKNYSDWRNDGKDAARGDWLFYLDADERITPELAAEIISVIESQKHAAYTVPRYEVFLGKHLKNWGDSRVLRLIERKNLKKWVGALHEQPDVTGSVGKLKQELIHLSHKNIDEKVQKTLVWSRSESEMLLKSSHPPVVWWRFVRIILTEIWIRGFKQGLWKDGTEGWIEIIYQSFSRFLTYVRLWELQQNPSLKDIYKKIDKDLVTTWQKKTK